MEPVGITNACTRVVVPNSSKIIVTVHSAIKPRGGSAATTGWADAPEFLSSTTVLTGSTASIVTGAGGTRCYPEDSGKLLAKAFVHGDRLHNPVSVRPGAAEDGGRSSHAADQFQRTRFYSGFHR